MKVRVNDIKLKHLDQLTCDKIDYKYLMEDIMQFKSTWWNINIMFKTRFQQLYRIIKAIEKIDISTLSATSNCKITFDKDVDKLTYQKRIEIEQLRASDVDISTMICKVIGITCFDKVHSAKFDSGSPLFEKWCNHIQNQPLVEMIGLYNDIIKAIDKSNLLWAKLFSQVAIIDNDYEQANGHTFMARFDLLNIIKKTIDDFNVTYEQAFVMEYRIIRSNALLSASQQYVGQQMADIKQKRMEAKRLRK